MRKSKTKFRLCGRITALVILMSFLMTYRAHGEPQMTQAPISSEGGTRQFSEFEVETLIDDLTVAAEEAIEKAAAEAAKAAALAALEREAAAMREAAQGQAEAERWRFEAETAKRNGVKNAVLTGLICLLSGLALGVGGTLIIGGR